MLIFDGKQFAAQKEAQLLARIHQLKSTVPGITPHVGCLVFTEDQGGLVYSQEKQTVAARLGIVYDIVQTSLTKPIEELIKLVQSFANDPQITGIIIQKPWRANWQKAQLHSADSFEDFQTWWHTLTSEIPLNKDIDGLHPETLEAVKTGTWQQQKLVLPATCRAVLSILKSVQQHTPQQLDQEPAIIVGRSELLGTPLFFELQHLGWPKVQLAGQKELGTLLNSPQQLREFTTIISSTGIHNLITESMIRSGSIIIDAGFPQGDVDFEHIASAATFITPVPNGVGPVTVICLLENVIELCYNSAS